MAIVNIYDSIALLEPVKVYADGNQNVSSAPASIDSVALVMDDRVALGNQTDKTETGIWIFKGTGNAMVRATDMDSGATIKSNTLFCVQTGIKQGSLFYSFINNADGFTDITVGTTEVISKRVNDDSLPYGPVIPNPSDTQADATLIEYVHTVCALAAYDNGSVKLPFYSAGKYCIIDNRLRGYSTKVYPFLGGYIRGSAGTNQPITLQAGELVVFRGIGDTGLGQEWVPDQVVSQLIRSGVKYLTPSEDAVFNALALKAPKSVIAKNFTPASSTVSSGEEILHVLNVAAGDVVAGDLLYQVMVMQNANNGATKTYKTYINTVPNLTGSPIQINQSTSFTTGTFTAGLNMFYAVTSDTTLIVKSGGATGDIRPDFQTSATPSLLTVPSLSAGFYLIITLTISSSATPTKLWYSILKRFR